MYKRIQLYAYIHFYLRKFAFLYSFKDILITYIYGYIYVHISKWNMCIHKSWYRQTSTHTTIYMYIYVLLADAFTLLVASSSVLSNNVFPLIASILVLSNRDSLVSSLKGVLWYVYIYKYIYIHSYVRVNIYVNTQKSS
jgi:hypothetical protein